MFHVTWFGLGLSRPIGLLTCLGRIRATRAINMHREDFASSSERLVEMAKGEEGPEQRRVFPKTYDSLHVRNASSRKQDGNVCRHGL